MPLLGARNFGRELRREWGDAENDINRRLRAWAIACNRPVVLGTPVRTGRARGGWVADVNRSPTGGSGRTDKSGAGTLARVNAKAAQFGMGKTYHLRNNLNYISDLERGRRIDTKTGRIVGSLQAPEGWVNRSVQNVTRELTAKGVFDR